MKKNEKTLTMAAAKAGMSRKTARKYLKSGKLSRQSQPSLPAPVLKNLLESLCCFSSLGVRDLPQDQQGRLVHSLRELGQQVDDPMIPAALLLGLGIDVAQSSPDAQVAVSDHQPWTAHPPALQVGV